MELRDASKDIASLNAKIIAISMDQRSGAERVVERLNLGFPVLFDPEGEVVRQYGVYNLLNDRNATPSTFLLDKNGSIRWSHVSSKVSDRPTTQRIISELGLIEQG